MDGRIIAATAFQLLLLAIAGPAQAQSIYDSLNRNGEYASTSSLPFQPVTYSTSPVQAQTESSTTSAGADP